MEATRLASEACDAIKISRESIRTALRELGAVSDISEASGPTRARPQHQERPAMGRLEPAGRRPAVPAWAQQPPPPEWAAGIQPAASDWHQRLPPPRATTGGAGPGWPLMHTPAPSVWPPTDSLPRPRMREEEG
jgi:hypothetical protein